MLRRATYSGKQPSTEHLDGVYGCEACFRNATDVLELAVELNNLKLEPTRRHTQHVTARIRTLCKTQRSTAATSGT